MRTFLTAIALLFSTTSQLHAAVLNFEDLDPSPASYSAFAGDYHGFTFSGWYFGPDTTYTPASGSIDLFTDYADPGEPAAYVITTNNWVSSSTPFIFEGASFSGYSGTTFELYLNGSLVHTSASLSDASGADPYLPTFLASGYFQPVDTVKVRAVQGYYSMDDFHYGRAISPIPEPATYQLTIFGLVAVAITAIHRRRRGLSR